MSLAARLMAGAPLRMVRLPVREAARLMAEAPVRRAKSPVFLALRLRAAPPLSIGGGGFFYESLRSIFAKRGAVKAQRFVAVALFRSSRPTLVFHSSALLT